jgi:hypothetical protein
MNTLMHILLKDINFMHWFYINSEVLTIYTYGSGDHPTKTYVFKDVKKFKNMIKRLKNDNYQFIKDQANK